MTYSSLKAYLILSVWLGFAAIFFEWLFLYTGYSNLTTLTFWRSFSVFVTTGLLFATAIMVVVVVLAMLSYPLQRWRRVILAFPMAIASVVVALLLVDNATYTFWQIGIVNSSLIGRIFYLCASAVGLVWFTRKFIFFYDVLNQNTRILQMAGRATLQILVLLLVLCGLRIGKAWWSAGTLDIGEPTIAQLPDIIVFGSDGVTAQQLPMYGYERNTTPFLQALADESLIFENAFSNSGKTTGSLVSLLTGRLPTSTKVAFPPHSLAEEDALLHLPGMLRRLGYRTFQETVRYYGDGFDLNMQGGFDWANDREIPNLDFELLPPILVSSLAPEILFSYRVITRVRERLLHLAGTRPMINYYRLVTQPERRDRLSDSGKIEHFKKFTTRDSPPIFAHFHLMTTHCCSYKPKKSHWSGGQKQDKRFMDDFFDDALLQSDELLSEVFAHLQAIGRDKNTVIVYYSDHGRSWNANVRIPLVFRFPQGEYAGRVKRNAQLIDVAPTLLSYIGLQIPEWMDGVSLLKVKGPERERPAFAVGSLARAWVKVDGGASLTALIDPGPPSYGITRFHVTVCHRVFTFKFNPLRVKAGDVEGHTDPCDMATMPSHKEVTALLQTHLERHQVKLW